MPAVKVSKHRRSSLALISRNKDQGQIKSEVIVKDDSYNTGETPHQTRIHVSLSLNTIESLFDIVKYGFWSGEAILKLVGL